MKIKGLRWWIIGLVCLATIINYIDRSALAIMWPDISKDLGMSKNDYALILNIFLVAYAVGQSISGKMFDKIGTKIGFTISITLWGIATAIHALARGVYTFSFFRVLLGLGEAGNWPGAVKSNAEWFPAKERAFAQGIFNSGAALGSIVAPPLIAVIWFAIGWEMTFVLLGLLGIIWVIPWLFFNKALPEKTSLITKEERAYILSGTKQDDDSGGDEKELSMTKILSYRESWAVLASRFFVEPIWWLFVGWMPIYLADVYGFNVKEIGFFAWVPYVGAAFGSLAGGYFSGRLLIRGLSVDTARKRTILVGCVIMFLGMIATILIGDTPVRFVAIVAVVLFGFQFVISNIQTIPSDLFSGKSVGSLAGLGGTVGIFSVIMMNSLVPYISNKYSYTPIFIMIAALIPLGYLSIRFFAPKIKRVG